METVLIIIIAIDFILLFVGKIVFYLKAFKVVNLRDLLNRVNEALPDLNKEGKERIKWKDKNWWRKILAILFLPFQVTFILFVSLFLIGLGLFVGVGIPTAGIWGTIWIGSSAGLSWAVIFLIIMNVIYFFSGLGMVKASRVDNKTIKKVLINDVIKFAMYSLALYYIGFDYNLSIQNLIQTPFGWNIVINNVVSIGIPMIFYALLFTNIFALGVRFKNIATKNPDRHSIIRLHQVLFIFISACFIGILIITDVDYSFMSVLERSMYFETLEVVKWIVTSVFIPLFLFTLSSHKKVDKEVIVNRRVVNRRRKRR